VLSRRLFLGSPFAALLQSAETNPRIREARNAAVAVLKPTEKDLQHGLELHARSLVVESYGFSPRSAIDGDAMRQAIEAGASPVELDDLHVEMLLARVADDASQRQEYLDAWNASGVTCVLQNAGEEGSAPLRLLKRLAHFTYLTDMLRDHVSRAAVPDDIEAAKKQGRHCLYLTGNGVPLAQEWKSVNEELE
jgi:membrane dipeptidase